ncbi:MAG: hypothetical protein JNL74_02385, partial [Fibrobacteres bacterium]|nr:hypothetical protein [Fibrobacterota bacterium]
PIPLVHNESFSYAISARGNEFDNGPRTLFTSVNVSLSTVKCDTLDRGTPGFLQMILAETDTLGNIYCLTTTDRTFKIYKPDISIKTSAPLPALLPWNQLYRKNGMTVLTQFERWGTRLMMINDSGILSDSFTLARHDNWVALRDTFLCSPTVNGYEKFSLTDGRYLGTVDLYSTFNCPRTVPEIFSAKNGRMFIESSCYPGTLIAENLYSNGFTHIKLPMTGSALDFEDADNKFILMKSTTTDSSVTYATLNLLSADASLLRRVQIELPPNTNLSGRCSILPNGFVVPISHGQLLRFTYR